MISAKDYRPDIDGLRTVAVIPVVLYHAGLGLTGGYVGVDIFFVISGYLITGILYRDIEAKRFSLLTFYERRLRRLYPALFAMLAVTCVFAIWLMIPPDLAEYGGSVVATSFYVSNVFFFLQSGYFTEAAHLKPLLHTWSLAVEEQFYIFFPPALWVAARLMSKRWLIVALAVVAALCFVLSIVLTDRSADAAFYLLPTRAWELALGSLLALGAFPSLVGRARVATAISLGSVAAIFWSVVTYTTATPFPGAAALLPVLGATGLIWVGAEARSLVTRLLSAGPMVFVGKLSYSLYLWHWPVVVFATYGGPEKPSVVLGMMIVGVSLILAYLSWRYIEQPVRERRLFERRRDVFVWGGVASGTAIAIGLALVLAKGLPMRADPALLAMLNPEPYLHENRLCHDVTPARAARGDVCVLGTEDQAPSFVLAGDSHADALSPGVFLAAEVAGLSGWQYTGPGFVPMIDVRMQGHADPTANVAAFVDFLKATPAAETVILTGYWQHYATGETYRHRGTRLIDTRVAEAQADNISALTAGLARLFDAFPDRQFLLLDDVPTGNDLYLKHYARSVVVPWRAPLTGLPVDEAAAQYATYAPAFADLSVRFANVRYVSLLQSACTDVCPLFDESGPRYRDGDHLSSSGARALAPALAALFQ